MGALAYKITFLGLIVLGMGFYVYVAAGNFPVAIVNRHFVPQKEYEATLSSVLNYYVQSQNPSISDEIDLKTAQKEIKRLALERSIETELVREEAKRRLGPGFLALVEKKILELQNYSGVKNIAAAVYGFVPETSDVELLRPLAERQVLDERLGLENTNWDDWLSDAKNSAHVILLIQNFSWYGSVVSDE